MNSAAHAKAIAQLRDKDARALFPVLLSSGALAFAVIAVFSIEAVLSRFIATTTGLVLLALLLATQFISAAFATSKLQELIWWREFTDNTVSYLRTLPIPKHRVWFVKVQITALAGLVVLALITVSAVYGIPFIVNMSINEPQKWGVAWMRQTLSADGASAFAPFILLGLAGMALLSFIFTCAPVGPRRWRQREPVWLSIAGRRISAHRINSGIVIAIGLLMLGFSFVRWPIVVPASLLTASVILWYLSSYLAFSAINLSVRDLKRWIAIAAAATVVTAIVNIAASVYLAGAQTVAYRMTGYALARPLATGRYTAQFVHDMRVTQIDLNTMIETMITTYLLDRDTVVALKPQLGALLEENLHCAHRRVALALLAVDTPRDNAGLSLLIDRNGLPRATLQNADCEMPAAEFATLLLHAADDATALQFALRLLAAPGNPTRLIGAELAARIPAIAAVPSRQLEHLVLRSLPKICSTRTDPGWRAGYVRAHIHALSQLTLHRSLSQPDDIRRALDTDCAHAAAQLAAVWTPIVTSQNEIDWDFKTAFARDFEFATGARFDFNLDDITPASFNTWTRRDLPWEKLDAPMRCYLARQWHLTHRVPPLYAVRHLIKLPAQSFVFGISTGRDLFREADCE